jgi:response regulator of citrate/malate metabolism
MVCPKLKETKSILEGNNIGLIILDMTFPTFSGLDILEHISSRKINTSVIIYSGCISQYSSKLQSYINSGIILKVYEKPTNNFEEIISFIDEIK